VRAARPRERDLGGDGAAARCVRGAKRTGTCKYIRFALSADMFLDVAKI
jgi:hypothetical protein